MRTTPAGDKGQTGQPDASAEDAGATTALKDPSLMDDEVDDPARGGPSCQLAASPSLAQWGGEIKLKARKPARFGGVRGEVRLHESRDPSSPSWPLLLMSWQDSSISGRLPSVPPSSDPKEYFLSVTRSGRSKACGFLSMASRDNTIQSLQSPFCAFTPAPLSAQWGHPVIVTATVPGAAGFGSTPGTVRIHNVDGTTGTPLSMRTWSDAAISVTLPAGRGDLAEALAYGISVTRAGASDHCFFFTPLTVLPACTFSAIPTTVEWGTPVSLTAQLSSVGAGFGEAKGTVHLAHGGQAAVISGADVDWHDNEISVTLPPALPPGLALSPLYDITVTRAGAETPCWSSALTMTVVPPLDCSALPAWVKEVFTGPKLDEAIARRDGVPVLELDDQNGSQLVSTEVVKTSATNPLTELIALGTVPQDAVKFLFRLKDKDGGLDKSANAVAVGASRIGPGALPGTDLTALFRIKPALAPEVGGPDETEYRLGLDISIAVPGCVPSVLENVGGLLALVQKALPIPTIALLYEDTDFKHNLMVFLPEQTTIPLGLPGVHWDDRNYEELEQVRTPVANRLEWTGDVLGGILDKLGGLADGLPISPPALDFLGKALQDVQAASVVDASGRTSMMEAVVDDCGWWPWCPQQLYRKVSSLVLIGYNPPLNLGGPPAVMAFTSSPGPTPLFDGTPSCRNLDLNVQFGDIVAALPDLSTYDMYGAKGANPSAWPGIAIPDGFWGGVQTEYLCVGESFFHLGDQFGSIMLGDIQRQPNDDVPPGER